MSNHGSILISGAGIAGTALAYWLNRHRFTVTVLEREDALRDTGQNVDVRGAGCQVVRRMGLEDQVAHAGTGEFGTRFVDQRGRTVAEFPAGTGESDGATAELEILRGELIRLLAADSSDYGFGDSIEVHTLRVFLRVLGSKPVQGVANRLFTPPADDFVLPEYEPVVAADGGMGGVVSWFPP